jgi:hypothetical protein
VRLAGGFRSPKLPVVVIGRDRTSPCWCADRNPTSNNRTFVGRIIQAGLQIERLVETPLNVAAVKEAHADPARWYSAARACLMPTTFIITARKSFLARRAAQQRDGAVGACYRRMRRGSSLAVRRIYRDGDFRMRPLSRAVLLSIGITAPLLGTVQTPDDFSQDFNTAWRRRLRCMPTSIRRRRRGPTCRSSTRTISDA